MIVLRLVILTCLTICCGFSAPQTGLGRIHFPTSQTGEAQQLFLNGVLLLHSFQYVEAREHFQTAQKAAPDFALAYWGEAMTYNEPLWFAQDTMSARAVLARAPKGKPLSQREADYMEAVRVLYGEGSKEERDFRYAEAMRRMYERYPDDHEAAAFYALALLGTAHRGRDFRIYMKAAAIVEDILAQNPEHPGALHYAIHCYDDPVHAPLGLRAARVYAKVAPESSHALHMPSHIFFAMGMWDDAARSNEDAFRASERSAQRTRQLMEAGGYHALWWLQYAYLQQGRFADARKTLQTMERLASGDPRPLARFHLLQMRVMFAIETGEAYDSSSDLEAIDAPAVAAHHFARGMSSLHRGDQQEAERALQAIRSLGPGASTGTHHHQNAHIYPGDAQVISIMENELAAMLAMANGKSKEAIALLKSAVATEDKTPYEFGPPSPPKPAHELLGEMLLSLGQPRLARVQFELALLRAPKRALSLLGLARAFESMGDTAAARRSYSELRQIWSKADNAILKALDESLERLQSTPGPPSVP
jgi:Putative Zn-dependent protease, contains TPR repeats